MDRGVCYSTIQLGKRQKKNCRKSRRTSFFPSLKQDDIVGKKETPRKGYLIVLLLLQFVYGTLGSIFPFFPALDTTIHKLSTGILVTDYIYKWLGHIKLLLYQFSMFIYQSWKITSAGWRFTIQKAQKNFQKIEKKREKK